MSSRTTTFRPADVDEALQAVPLFSDLAPAHRKQIADVARLKELSRGGVLWRAGQPANFLGVVLAGRVALARASAGTESVFDVAGEGELLGDVGFTLSSTYTATVFCPRRARLLLVPCDVLRHVLEREPRMTATLAIQLATRLSRMMGRVETLSALSVDRRLAKTLLDLADHLGQQFPGGVLIPMKLRRADLASLAATTLETTSRKLSQWSTAGVVQKQPAGLLIRDLAALTRLANGERTARGSNSS